MEVRFRGEYDDYEWMKRDLGEKKLLSSFFIAVYFSMLKIVS
jgi:hypothetical protein